MNYQKYVYLIFAMLLLFSCKHDPLLLPIPNGEGIVIVEPCDPDLVYFEQQILPILNGCAVSECHDAESHEDDVILDSYENIINTGDIEPGDPNDSELYEVITENDLDDRMPPDPADPLSQASIDLIYDWISQGAVNNSCPDLICDTLEVTFSADIEPMVNTFCGACHTGSLPYGGIEITSYIQISDVAADASFIGLIDGTVSPVMPENTDGLSDCQVRMFEIWIENGMPND